MMKGLLMMGVLCVSMLPVVSASAADADAAPAERVFRAGIAKSNVTPWLGISLAGHMSDRQATNINDELFARCLALDNGEARLAIVLVDNCLIPREVTDAAKARVHEAIGLEPAHILIAATHTHSGPTVTPIFQSEPDPTYQQFLVSRIADGVIRAFGNLEPARIGWAAGAVPDQVFNRRWHLTPGTMPANPFGETTDQVKTNPGRAVDNLIEPAGPTDPEVAFLALQRPDGSPLAVLANYSLHYVGGTRGAEISADYFGIFAERLEAMLAPDRNAPPVLAILSNGTSGDINNINFRESGVSQQPYEQMTFVAEKVAQEVFRVYKTVEFHEWAPLAAAQEDLALGVRRPGPEELERARTIVAAAQGPVMQGLDQIYARETILLDAYPTQVPVIVQALRIGDTAIAAMPCEVFVEIGLAVKQKSPFARAFTVSLANGYNGYLPTAEQHALGGYETWRARSSYLEVDAADKMLAAVFRLFDSIE